MKDIQFKTGQEQVKIAQKGDVSSYLDFDVFKGLEIDFDIFKGLEVDLESLSLNFDINLNFLSYKPLELNFSPINFELEPFNFELPSINLEALEQNPGLFDLRLKQEGSEEKAMRKLKK